MGADKRTFVARDALVQGQLRINASGKHCVSSWRCSHGQDIRRMHLQIQLHTALLLKRLQHVSKEHGSTSIAAARACMSQHLLLKQARQQRRRYIVTG